jgi:large subunit ribosomal protein L21
MLAIVEIAGKQFKVSEQMDLVVPKLSAKVGDKIKLDKVLLVEEEGKRSIGSSTVKGAVVEATVMNHGQGKKIIVFRKKAKKTFKRTRGHKQQFTTIHIDNITQSN